MFWQNLSTQNGFFNEKIPLIDNKQERRHLPRYYVRTLDIYLHRYEPT